MRLFPNLETLTLVGDIKDKCLAYLNTLQRVEVCMKDLQAWYAKEKELRPLTPIPKIDARFESIIILRKSPMVARLREEGRLI